MVIRPDTVAARLGGFPGIQAFLKGSAVPALRGIGSGGAEPRILQCDWNSSDRCQSCDRRLGRYRRRLERKLVPGKVTFRWLGRRMDDRHRGRVVVIPRGVLPA
jgi:hypothetical protein